MLAALEDHVVQNPFTAIGHVKPGRFRRWTLVVILFYLDYATRHFFNRGNLAGVKTIHFARWVFIDDKRRVFFASNYDGSLESYMDDFIDKVAWGLNLVFSNGVGYPRTQLARARRRAGRARVQGLPAHAPGADARLVLGLRPADRAQHRSRTSGIRAGLRGDPSATRASVGAVAVTRRPRARDIQGLFARGYGDLRAAAFLLLGIEDAAAARRWLGAVAGAITTRRRRGRSERAVNLAFTSSGLARLGLAADDAGACSRTSSSTGMTTPHRTRILGDLDENAPRAVGLGRPETAPQSTPRCSSTRATTPACARSRRSRRAVARAGGLGVAHRLGTSDLDDFEPFGFRDGISQPFVEGLSQDRPARDDRPRRRVRARLPERVRPLHRPAAARRRGDPARMLPRDADGSGRADLGRNGSYLVFRQLRQDVPRVLALPRRRDAAPRRRRATRRRALRLAAKMVGRWPSGAPLALAPDADDPAPRRARTTSATTSSTRAGPAARSASHIRRSNPRDSLDPQPGQRTTRWEINRRHRILRRGREYGPSLTIDEALAGRTTTSRARPALHLPEREHRAPVRVRQPHLAEQPEVRRALRRRRPARRAVGAVRRDVHDPDRRRPRARDERPALRLGQGRRVLLPARPRGAALPGRDRRRAGELLVARRLVVLDARSSAAVAAPAR